MLDKVRPRSGGRSGSECGAAECRFSCELRSTHVNESEFCRALHGLGSLRGVNLDDLPLAEFAFPGPLRDQLVAAILSGAKTSTSGLALEYEREKEPLPEVGQQSAVVDSEG